MSNLLTVKLIHMRGLSLKDLLPALWPSSMKFWLGIERAVLGEKHAGGHQVFVISEVKPELWSMLTISSPSLSLWPLGRTGSLIKVSPSL